VKIRLFDLVTSTCSVAAPEPVHDVMSHYLGPYAVPALGHPDMTLAVSSDINAVSDARHLLDGRCPLTTRASHPEHRYHSWTTAGGGQIMLPEHDPDHVITAAGNRVLVTAARPGVAATIGTRVVRQFIMRSGEARGGRCVHAAAAGIDGGGVLIGGHPGAGKTSVLTHLIEHHGARPVANDRVMLVPVTGRRWLAVGVPLAWRFTPQAVSGSPTLTAGLAAREPSRGRDLVDGKAELTPQEVSWLLNAPAMPATRITRVVILARSPAGTLPASPDAAFVRRQLDFGGADMFAGDWLGIRPRFSPIADPLPVGDWWAALAGTLPVQVMSWTEPGEFPRLAAAMSGEPS
jgi:hypothetical protein